MHKRGMSGLLLAALLVPVSLAFAASPDPTLPDGVEAHISVRAPGRVLTNLIQYVSGSTKGTNSHIPPEFLGMMLEAYLPFSMGCWNPDGDAHVVVLDTGRRKGATVVVLPVNSFEEFSKGLEERDWTFGEAREEDAAGFVAMHPVLMPDGTAMVIVDLGENRVALAAEADDVRAVVAAGDWLRPHTSKADVSALVPLAGEGNTAARMRSALDEVSGKLAAELAAAGIAKAVADGYSRLFREYGPLLGNEIDKAGYLLVELTLDSGDLALDVGGYFREGAYLRSVAEFAANNGPAKSGLTARVPGEPVSVAVMNPHRDILPGFKTILATLATDLGEIYPEAKNDLVFAAERFSSAGYGASVVANYTAGAKQYQVNMLSVEDPVAAVEGILRYLDALDGMLAASFTNPEESVRFEKVSGGRSGAEWHSYRLRVKNPEKFREFVARIEALSKSSSLNIAIPEDGVLYVLPSEKAGAVALVFGNLDEDEFRGFAAGFAEGGKDGKDGKDRFALPEAEKVLSGLDNTRISAAVTDANGFFLLLMGQYLDAMAQQRGGVENAAGKAALEQLAGRFAGVTAPCGGMGIGAENGWLLVRVLIPLEAMNRIVLDYEMYTSAEKAERRRLEAPPETEKTPESPEDEDGTGEDEEAEDEEVPEAA